jgi:hypothetical protein
MVKICIIANKNVDLQEPIIESILTYSNLNTLEGEGKVRKIRKIRVPKQVFLFFM